MKTTPNQGATAAQHAAAAVPTQYLTFTLGGEMFAIGILGVKEIIEYASLTDVPMMNACIRGVINLRGSVVTVMDLSVRFNRPAGAVTKRTCIIIVEIEDAGERQVIGVVVDAVNAVIDIADGDIEPPPAFGAHIRNDFIAGMGKINGRFVILLQIGQVFAGLLHDEPALAVSEH
jgi:purine-binding chemotaxis protein CheW